MKKEQVKALKKYIKNIIALEFLKKGYCKIDKDKMSEEEFFIKFNKQQDELEDELIDKI